MTVSSESLPARSAQVGVARRMGVNAGLALAGDIAGKLGVLAVLVIAARLLSTSQFALLGVALAAVSVVTVLLDSGAWLTIVRDGSRDRAMRGGLLVASLAWRGPLLAAAFAGAVAVGLWSGRLLEAVLVVASAAVGATTLSLLGVFRAAQDLGVEARQKLAIGLAGPALAAAAIAYSRSAAAVLAALAVSAAATVPWLALKSRRVAGFRARPAIAASIRAAAPFALMAIATLVYYRAGTFLLSAWRPALDVAAFTIAAAVAQGLLALPNAVTTSLLPRLGAEANPAERLRTARRALRWTVVACALTAAGTWVFAPWGLELVFGGGYEPAVTPLLILATSNILIGVSAVLGTVLTAARRMRLLLLQVGFSLTIFLGAGAVLIPRLGAVGAAWATVVTEAVALLLLAVAAQRAMPGLLASPLAISLYRRILILGAAAAGIGGFLALFAKATATGYGLRVISDTPTFLALVRDLSIAPLTPASPFLVGGGVETSHATPYMQALAWIWDVTAPAHDVSGHPQPDPEALYRFLAVCGLVVVIVLFHAAWLWARSQAGPKAAWIALPVLAGLFGPAHVIWAGDLSFHAFLYGSFYPQNLAAAFSLYTLAALERREIRWAAVIATLGAAATLLVHPFTGLLLAGLITILASWRALRAERGWFIGPLALGLGYLIGLAWPAFSLDVALGESGVRGHVLIAVSALVPCAFRLARRRPAALGLATFARLRHERLLLWALALLGFGLVAGLALWQWWLFGQPNPDPLVHSNRLSLYWVEDRWRWPLLLGAGAVGLVGLLRLMRRNRPVAPLWFAGCFAFGVLGAAGLELPLWHRFILYCQIPLALGVAIVLAESGRGWLRRTVVATFAFTLAFKVVTLTATPERITYFGTRLQDSYRLGGMVPKEPGLVATDPFTSYFVPAATGHRVLVVTKAHVGSGRELRASEQGYELLHEFYTGEQWWEAAQRMYRRGVRYVVVEHSTSLAPPTLAEFSTGPTPLIRTKADRRVIGTYHYRNNRVGTLVFDSPTYAVYRLEASKLW